MGTTPLLAKKGKKLDDNERKLRFVHITDSHLDLSDTDTVEALELAVSHINQHYKNLDFVLFGGDNFNNNVIGEKDALIFRDVCEKLHCPYYAVRGNKESSPTMDETINLQEFQKLFVADKGLKTSGKDWLLEIKGYNILGLDSCIEGQNNGRYSEETLKFAEQTLKNKKPTVILNHHPYSNYWKSKDKKDIYKYVLNNTKETQKRLFKYSNLVLTLSGHKHIDSVTKIKHTKVIVTRGFIRPFDLDMFPMRFVELDGRKVHEKLIYTS